MKKISNAMFSFLIFHSGISSFVNSQEAIVTSGLTKTTTSGNISYTVGQLDYVGLKNNTAQINLGVQQAYVISTVSVVEVLKAKFITVYPNPTSDNIVIDIKSQEFLNPMVRLFNIEGKLLIEEKIFQDKFILHLRDFPVSSYFVKVYDQQNEIETFKIIKN